MKIKSGEITALFPEKLSDFDFYTEEPYVIFQKEDFLNQEGYNLLAKNLDEYIKQNNLKKSETGKECFPIYMSDIDILKKGYVKDFCNIFFTKSFKTWFKKTHLPYFQKFRGFSFFYPYKRSRFIKVLGSILSVIKIPINIFQIQIEFSHIVKDGFIAPHTDASSKRLAFVFYIPKDPTVLTPEIEKNWGTVFWRARKNKGSYKSWKTNHQLSEAKLKKFYSHYTEGVISEYKPNKLNGFIKSNVSWHSVKPNNTNIDRRAIVINVYQYL